MTTTACDDQYAPDTSARDELLDKLAMELAEWPDSIRRYPDDLPCSFWGDLGQGWECYAKGNMTPITKKDWLRRRIELINCPPDSEAPEWAEWKAQLPFGGWMFFESRPDIRYFSILGEESWSHDGLNHKSALHSNGKIPAGHDWRITLTRINRDDNTSTPEEEAEFRRIQARIDSEKPHEADARMLDAQWMSSVARFGCVNTKQACDNITANFKAIRDLNSDPESYSDEQLERDIATFREVYKIAEDECATLYGTDNNEPDSHYRHEYKGIKLDPYRIAKIYNMDGGPREQIMKKTLRFTDKGQTEQQVVNEIRSALDRWQQMLDEDQ